MGKIEQDSSSQLQTELVYVFLGSALPDYALSSMQFSAKSTGNPVRVLANFSPPRKFPEDISWTLTSSFYREQDFSDFRDRSKLPGDFRDGFWLKTAERFFVLRDYLRYSGNTELFHAELDVLVYSLGKLEQAVRETMQHGIFVPREAEDRVVASLVYINSLDALEELCIQLTDRADRGNEMDILGSLTALSSPWMHNLPTAEYLYRPLTSSRNTDPWPVVGGGQEFVADGAVLGRWLFGVDPRNTDFAGTQNLIQEQKNTVPFDFPLDELRFKFDKSQRELMVQRLGGSWNEVTAIHVHSKIHNKLSVRRLMRIIGRANKLRRSTIVSKELQWYRRFILRLAKDFGLFTRSQQVRTAYFFRARDRFRRWLFG